MVTILLALAALFLAGHLFFRLYPSFGGKPKRKHLKQSPNYRNRKFINQIPTSMAMHVGGAMSLIRDSMRRNQHKRPAKPLLVEHPDPQALLSATIPELVWFGHSASLLRLQSQTILLDPMLGPSPSPFTAIGPRRFSKSLPMTPEEIPHVDAVLISHDHYDHLDYPTIKKLRSKTDKFFVPLGVGAHLRSWGVKPHQIVEMDWWDEAKFESLTFVCTPARHFSGRTLTDRYKTLWCSWVISGKNTKLFFSGDTGYGPHFKQIGEKYGPFDLTLMECGQYDERWPNIHMMPEQTLAAHQDVRGRRLFPLHWGAFVLALHPWADSVERLRKVAKAAHVPVVTPRIGEIVSIKAPTYPKTTWWKAYS